MHKEVLDDNYLAITAIVTVGMQFVFWQIANFFKFDKVTDIAGAMNFALINFLTFFLNGSYYRRQVVLFAFVCAWAFRLGGFLLYRVLLRGKDERFDQMRENFWAFFGFWVFQMIWVWVVSLPVTFLHASVVDSDITARDWIGWVFFVVGFIIEIWADFSKNAFNNDSSNKGKFLSSGIWAWSRHPNYFGEILLWLGLFLTSSSVYDDNTKAGYVSVLSPIITAVLLLFLSGIPPAEARYDKKFGDREDYREYKRSTSPLIPLPPALYRALPSFFQALFLCEFPFYSTELHKPRADSNGASDPHYQISP